MKIKSKNIEEQAHVKTGGGIKRSSDDGAALKFNKNVELI